MIKNPNWLFCNGTFDTGRCLRLVLVCPPLHFCGVSDPPIISDGTVITGGSSGAVSTVVGDQAFESPNPTFIVHQDVVLDYTVGESLGLVGWTLQSQSVVRCPTGVDHQFIATIDTYLDEANHTTNHGNGENLRFGRESNFANRTVMNFDVSSLAGATVISGKIRLEITSTLGGASAAKAKRITQVWVEMQATWDIYSTGNNWTALGGDMSTPEVDVTMPAIAISTEFEGFGDMVADALANHSGIMRVEFYMIGDTDDGIDDYCVFRDSEYATAAQRPTLIVNVAA